MRYKFVLRGHLSATLERSIEPLSVSVHGKSTEIIVDVVDDAELYGIIDRLERLRIGIKSFEEANSQS